MFVFIFIETASRLLEWGLPHGYAVALLMTCASVLAAQKLTQLCCGAQSQQ